MHRLTTLALLALATTSFAQDWGQLATISSTMGVQGGKLCLGEASRGDIGCPAYAPSVSPTGTLTTTAISLTTSGTNWGYLASNASYLPNLNTNNISATTLNGIAISQFTGGTAPTGQIAAFDLATCPTGWSEYTPARGRFLRGIDSTGTNDSIRAAGNTQADAFQDHYHTLEIYSGTPSGGGGNWQLSNSAMTTTNSAVYDPYPSDPAIRWASFNASQGFRTSAETRPKNVAVLYCRKN